MDLRDVAYKLRKDMAVAGEKSDGAWLDTSMKKYVVSDFGPAKPKATISCENDKFRIVFSSELKNRRDALEVVMKSYKNLPGYEGIYAGFDDGTRLIF